MMLTSRSDQPEVLDVLHRLLEMLERSLPAYLENASLWTPLEDDERVATLRRVAADQHYYARAVAEAIAERGGSLDLGAFPVEYTALNDLAVDYVLRRAVESQRRDVERIRQCSDQLDGQPVLLRLAEEILGNQRGHLELLEKEAGL